MMRKIFVLIKYSKDKSVKGYILDISKSGIGLAVSKRIRKNILVEIIPKTVLPVLKGKIVFIAVRKKETCRYRLGVKFVSLDNDKKQSINKFIFEEIKKGKRIRINKII